RHFRANRPASPLQRLVPSSSMCSGPSWKNTRAMCPTNLRRAGWSRSTKPAETFPSPGRAVSTTVTHIITVFKRPSSFLIELDDTQDKANHIHSVWRDFTGDFGEDLLQQHYEASHHR